LNQASFIRFHDLKRGLIAGAIAIAINTILLQIGSALHIQTGHGGLLMWLAKHLGFAPIAWNQGILGMLPMKIWKTGFHLLVGMGMAVFYIFIVEPALGRKLSPLSKGFIYALVVWLMNATIILPGLGQGFAGSAVISLYGLVYYAFAHTVFFLVLALIYGSSKDRVTEVIAKLGFRV
jgi:hypothetical protein